MRAKYITLAGISKLSFDLNLFILIKGEYQQNSVRRYSYRMIIRRLINEKSIGEEARRAGEESLAARSLYRLVKKFPDDDPMETRLIVNL